jgi:hypothetical protein
MPQLRLIDPFGYTVPGTVITVPDDQVEAATANLRAEAAQYDSDYWAQFGHHLDTRQYRVA